MFRTAALRTLRKRGYCRIAFGEYLLLAYGRLPLLGEGLLVDNEVFVPQFGVGVQFVGVVIGQSAAVTYEFVRKSRDENIERDFEVRVNVAENGFAQFAHAA